jgi:hypothetical protein
MPHRLSVVWFSDLVGWSSLTAEDEDRAIALTMRDDPRMDEMVQRIGLQ